MVSPSIRRQPYHDCVKVLLASRTLGLARFIGMFNAVKTTKIYCRPSCSARPKPENVTTYPTREAAEAAGYRPCKRCRPDLGEQLRFATARTSLGTVLVAASDTGVRTVLMGASASEAERELRDLHPGAFLRRDSELRGLAARIVDSPEVDLDMRGTTFQLDVWRKLLEIPRGETRTYTQLAAEVGRPRSVRAVAHACASNRLGVLVPCHRVVRTDGSLAGYRWGLERKQALLAAEGAGVSR
jgi:AraC family transcriptional regulator, regulatory protein of adaptative response / methylated-DNA-[protein]-cysteine methyltransferase